MQSCKKTINYLSQVKQILETDLAETVNQYLADNWILIDIRNSRFAPRVYVLGRIS